ncbi:helix-turn-helix domain-containing protein [Haloarchaeobius sp. DFWS5]|uniref:helix-turn-helix domain-containing protein n=1 Tax=Haloarchaeobius sp. DFWS5 TaxID=3446114 RepID=UPI003EBC1988
MTTIVEASLPADEFALQETLDRVPDASFEIVRLVAHGDDSVMPFLWASSESADDFPAIFEADSSTRNVEMLADLGDEYLFQMEWTAHIRVIVYVLLEEEATLLDAVGTDDQWRLRLLFPEESSVSATYEFCEEHGVNFTVNRMFQISDSFQRGLYGLTEQQHETLVTASETGYYEVPRGVEQIELAEQLGVSNQALSERLRRGHGRLVTNALGPDVDTEPNRRG